MQKDRRQYAAVGDILAAARNSAGMSQKEIAGHLSKPQSFVSNYEKGQRRVDVLEFIQIAEMIGCDPLDTFKAILKEVARSKIRPPR